tara:strand:- start:235 stop:567 length:333 start_codon:yes stop_codon:yes gene_type:complete
MENFEEQLDLFEDTLPPETDEKGCNSFDDLVYVPPKENCKLLLSTLSEDQEKFLDDNLEFDERFIKDYYHDALCYTFSEQDWIYGTKGFAVKEYITFNDIFVHKDDLEKQ